MKCPGHRPLPRKNYIVGWNVDKINNYRYFVDIWPLPDHPSFMNIIINNKTLYWPRKKLHPPQNVRFYVKRYVDSEFKKNPFPSAVFLWIYCADFFIFFLFCWHIIIAWKGIPLRSVYGQSFCWYLKQKWTTARVTRLWSAVAGSWLLIHSSPESGKNWPIMLQPWQSCDSWGLLLLCCIVALVNRFNALRAQQFRKKCFTCLH